MAIISNGTTVASGGALQGSGASLTGISGTPTGAIICFGKAEVLSGFLFCDGSAVSRTTYSDLFTAIGTSFGSGDGSTTFNVPDLRGRVPAGKDDMGGSAANRLTSTVTGSTLGATGGSQTHTLSTAELASHGHSINIGAGGATSDGLIGRSGTSVDTTRSTNSNGSSNAHTNTQPTIILNYGIKT